MNLKETTLRSEVKYEGRIINLRQDTVALPDGREALRDVVEHPGGVGILPLDADGNAYMVRQYRSGVQDIVLEIPAGKLEYGEDPLDCGRRELMEEIGARAERYTELGRIYPTPAYCAENIYIYLATGLNFERQKLDEGEFLAVEKIPLRELVAMAVEGALPDAKTQVAVLRAAFMEGLL